MLWSAPDGIFWVCCQVHLAESAHHFPEVVEVILPVVGMDDYVVQVGCGIGVMRS